jgi:hypothetical protein
MYFTKAVIKICVAIMRNRRHKELCVADWVSVLCTLPSEMKSKDERAYSLQHPLCHLPRIASIHGKTAHISHRRSGNHSAV